MKAELGLEHYKKHFVTYVIMQDKNCSTLYHVVMFWLKLKHRYVLNVMCYLWGVQHPFDPAIFVQALFDMDVHRDGDWWARYLLHELTFNNLRASDHPE